MIQLNTKKRLSQLKQTFSERAHIELQRGRDTEAVNYCKKQDENTPKIYEEFGNIETKQGERTDLKEAIEKCQSVKEMAMEYPVLYCKYRNGIRDIFLFTKESQKKVKPYVIWLAGETGCGKTRLATSINEDFWISSKKLDWFDGYQGQKVAIFDDFRKGDTEFQWFLRLLDMYPINVPVKGGFAYWNPLAIIITCPRTPTSEFMYHDKFNNG